MKNKTLTRMAYCSASRRASRSVAFTVFWRNRLNSPAFRPDPLSRLTQIDTLRMGELFLCPTTNLSLLAMNSTFNPNLRVDLQFVRTRSFVINRLTHWNVKCFHGMG